jgi:hypothetical protein
MATAPVRHPVFNFSAKMLRTKKDQRMAAAAKRNLRQVPKSKESLQYGRNKAPVERVVDTKFATGAAPKSPPHPADLFIAVWPLIESEPYAPRRVGAKYISPVDSVA